MGGWGKCPCCKKEKDNLTEHHMRELGTRKVMICRECHNIIEEYAKLLAKLRSEKK